MKRTYNLQNMVYDFMQRSNLTFKTCQDVITAIKEEFSAIVSRLNYQNHEIYNLDETRLPYLSKIIAAKGTKKAIIKYKGQMKQKVTGMFLIRADGIKCKPFDFKGVWGEEN